MAGSYKIGELKRIEVKLTTNESGAASVTTGPIWGYLRRIEYLDDGLADTADIDITHAGTGETLYSADNVTAAFVYRLYALRTAADLAAAEVTDIGNAAVPHEFAGEGITVAVAQGGDELSGTFRFVISATP